MDTNLGSFQLTKNQFSQIKKLNSELIKGFSYHPEDGRVTVVSEQELTEKEKNDLIASVNSLPDEEPDDDADVLARFDPKLARKRISEVFPIDRQIVLSPYAYAIAIYLDSFQFEKLKAFLNGLVSFGVATQEDLDIFNSVLMEQKIDINKVISVEDTVEGVQ